MAGDVRLASGRACSPLSPGIGCNRLVDFAGNSAVQLGDGFHRLFCQTRNVDRLHPLKNNLPRNRAGQAVISYITEVCLYVMRVLRDVPLENREEMAVAVIILGPPDDAMLRHCRLLSRLLTEVQQVLSQDPLLNTASASPPPAPSQPNHQLAISRR
ncbi:unnamed protein product [Mesocestoides corti]|uniref:Uncharacterized protein n=1 Tax=Mesocestoides corti TaxID=53468 RepID=A0A0R3U9F3_MESCO|nr:unnamed protein product [Mesocestoides corti]